MAKNKKSGKKNKKLEDTLDYYNEKTTREVVEKLLDGIEDEEEEDENNSLKYEEDTEEEEQEEKAEKADKIDYDDANIYSRRRSRGRKAAEETDKKPENETYEEEESDFADDEFAEDYEIQESKDSNMTTRFIMVAMAALFLIVLTVFAVSLNNTKKELAEAQQKLTAAKISTGNENNTADTDVKPAISQSDEKLKKENENLKIENEKLKKQIGEMQTAENKDDTNNNCNNDPQQDNTGSNASSSNEENTSSDPIIPDTYVVEENDNFAKISEKLYGTQNYYLQIAEYNGMSPDEPLSIGTVIRIPIPEY